MARGGYDFVVVWEMDRKLEECKKEASKSGEDVIIDPPSPPSRHQSWKLGRRTRSGGVSSDAAREIVAKIACPTASFRKMRWRRNVHRAASLPRADMIYWLRPLDDRSTLDVTKGSCADDFSVPSGGKTLPDRFGFYVDERPVHLVAIGRVHRGESILHFAPLPAHLVKVVVEEAVDGGAEVPIHTEVVSLVREALGTFIAWPKDLVVADFIKYIERSEPPEKHARQDDRSSHSDTLKELFSVAATLFSDPLQVPPDTTSFGCGADDVPLYISYNDFLGIIQDKQWRSLSLLQFWTL
ncbi:hypothetical protein OROMI_021798 [Orobanche minor]